MDINSYKRFWRDNDAQLTTDFSGGHIQKLDGDTLSFLTQWGLPTETAPFLNFDLPARSRLTTANEVFGIDIAALNSHLIIGTNGAGDPICIDTTKDYEVVYLNHDNHFDRVTINKTVCKFGYCLIEYNTFLNSLINSSPDDFARRCFSDDELNKLKRTLIEIDRTCLTDESFWKAELDELVWERDNG